jgi:hypothetical protein
MFAAREQERKDVARTGLFASLPIPGQYIIFDFMKWYREQIWGTGFNPA